jgi:hypothetical protein
MGLRGVPAFGFQQGHDAVAEQAYREIAQLFRGRQLPLRFRRGE